MYNDLTHIGTGSHKMNYSSAQKAKANEVLGGYAAQGAKFSSEPFQPNQNKSFIFRAEIDGKIKFVVIGERGAIIDHGWV